MKNIFVREKSLSKNKSYCFQVFLNKPCIYNILTANFDFFDFDRCYFNWMITVLGDTLSIHIVWDKKTDHAGFSFDISILGFNVDFNIYDNRHWDEDNDNWVVYDDENIKK